MNYLKQTLFLRLINNETFYNGTNYSSVISWASILYTGTI